MLEGKYVLRTQAAGDGNNLQNTAKSVFNVFMQII